MNRLLGDWMKNAVSTNELSSVGGSASVTRRQMVKAGAWAAPAVVMTVATPAASASTDSTTVNSVTFGQSTNGHTIQSVTANLTRTGSSITYTIRVEVVNASTSNPVPGYSFDHSVTVNAGTNNYSLPSIDIKDIAKNTQYRLRVTVVGVTAPALSAGTFTR